MIPLVLRVYQSAFLRGRPLDQQSETEVLEGETLPIFASRDDILETGMSELIEQGGGWKSFRFSLEVTFYGEEAVDAGGPRKEFFVLMLQEMVKEEVNLFRKNESGRYLLLNDSTKLRRKYYYGAGLLCGLSMLENGPLPCFLAESEIDALMSRPNDLINLSESQKQFRDGFNKLGLVDLLQAKPAVTFLLRPTARKSLTTKMLLAILKPVLSERGSNQRAKEEAVYTKLIRYVKEVAAGRRRSMTLEQILLFTTGTTEPPVLGFSIEPSIMFVEGRSVFPTSSTCTNTLYLSTNIAAEDENIFDDFDVAFLSNYFGVV